jgi:hypothetical protein
MNKMALPGMRVFWVAPGLRVVDRRQITAVE